MLKFLIGSALVASAQAAGVIGYEWDGNGVIDPNATPALEVTDPIGSGKNAIDVDTDGADTTYVGLFAGTLTEPASHTELATGGPITKIACAGATTGCVLPLYRDDDVFDPVPSGTYKVWAVDGDDLDYGNSIQDGVAIDVTVNPYISAWGSTLGQTAAVAVERGDDILVTFDGLDEGDVIELRDSATLDVGYRCPVDIHTVTAAEETLKRNTISLKTSSSGQLNSFAIPGTYDIRMVAVADTGVGVGNVPGYASLADVQCDITTNAPTWPVRTAVIDDSDTVDVVGHTGGGTKEADVEAGSTLDVNYNLASTVTAGTYVGLWLVGSFPNSHVVDADGTAGQPIAATFLPVGASGAGTVELKIPLVAAAGDYYIGVFNTNDAYTAALSPLAEHSYGALGFYGPARVTAMTAADHDTDMAIISSPTGEPSGQPSGEPSGEPTSMPTSPTGEPTGIPTSSPSFVEEPWGEYVWTEKRHRKAGMCENQCSGHGTCEVNGNCKCFTGLDGEDEWTGPDCSSRTCPFDFAWVGASINSNNLHPWAECSNKGICDRSSGECQCFTGYEGAACQRTVCPDNCNDQGTCWPEKHLASKAGRVYDAPWDAMKHVGCLCDAGYRGPACDQQECPSGADPLAGYGNEAGRDCSGRGICDYSNGICACFTGFFGTRCQHQTTVM